MSRIPKTRRIYIRCTEAMHELVLGMARTEGKSTTALLESWIDNHLEQAESINLLPVSSEARAVLACLATNRSQTREQVLEAAIEAYAFRPASPPMPRAERLRTAAKETVSVSWTPWVLKMLKHRADEAGLTLSRYLDKLVERALDGDQR